MIEQKLPEFTLEPALDGMPGASRADFVGGKPKLLNIWASWCVPCIAEAPHLERLKEEGVEIIGISVRDRPEAVAGFLSRYGNPYTRIGADDISELMLEIGASGVPETYVIDAQGNIRYQHIGDIRENHVELLLEKLEGSVVMRFLIALLALIAAPLAAQSGMPPAPYAYTQLEDPGLEAEATALMHTLRCLKCQSQSIADSDAPMAGDMRHQVRSRLLAGESPDQIRDWLTQRYGDYVSYEPKVSSTTWPLFAIPLLLLCLVGLVLLRRLGKRNNPEEAAS